MKGRKLAVLLCMAALCCACGVRSKGEEGAGREEAVIKQETESSRKPDALTESEESLPVSYDGRKENRAPVPRSQGSLKTCWAFASLQALEASLRPKESLIFSADHMSRNNGFGGSQESGGEYTMSMAYLLSWRGPVLEADDPYGDGISPEGLTAVKHVKEIQIVPARDYDKIKRAVLEYGGVQSSLYTSMSDGHSYSQYYNPAASAYCYIGSKQPNHEAVIIGWDDQFSKENFPVEVNGDGAFLCTSSWGEEFGEQGCFYVSYYDSNIGMNNIVYTRTENPKPSEHIYQSDLRGWVGQIGYGADTVWICNVFTAAGNEELREAGFYATGSYTSYEIYVVTEPGTEEEIEEGNGLQGRRLAGCGSFSYAGYYTVSLDTGDSEDLRLSEGCRFAIVVRLTTPETIHPAAIEYDAKDGRTQVNLEDGEGYVSRDGRDWERTEKNQHCNLCLKAYTIDR